MKKGFLLLINTLCVFFVFAQEIQLGLPKSHDKWFGTALEFSPDEKYIATADQDAILLWDMSGEKVIKTFSTDYHKIKEIHFSHNSEYLAASFEYGHVVVWSLKTGAIHQDLHPDFSFTSSAHFEFSPDDSKLIAGGENSEVYIYDLATGDELVQFKSELYYTYIAGFTPDGKKVYSYSAEGYPGKKKMIQFWDLETKALHSSFTLELGTIAALPIIKEDSKSIFLLHKTEDDQWHIRNYDIASGSLKNELSFKGDGYYSTVSWKYAPQSDVIILNNPGGYHFYNVASNTVSKEKEHAKIEHTKNSWKVSPVKDVFYVVDEQKLQAISVTSHEETTSYGFDEKMSFIEYMDVSKSGDYIGFITADNKIRVVSTRTGKIFGLNGHMTDVYLTDITKNQESVFMYHYKDSKYFSFLLNNKTGKVSRTSISQPYLPSNTKLVKGTEYAVILQNGQLTVYDTDKNRYIDSLPFNLDDFEPLSTDRLLTKRRIGYATDRGMYHLYDLKSDQIIDSIQNVEFVSGDSSCFVMDDPWAHTSVYDTKTGKAIYTQKYKDAYMADSYYDNKNNITVFWSKHFIVVVEHATQTVTKINTPKSHEIRKAGLSPDGNFVVCQSGEEINVYNVSTKKMMYSHRISDWSRVENIHFTNKPSQLIIERSHGLHYTFLDMVSGSETYLKTREVYGEDHLHQSQYLPKKDLFCAHGYEANTIGYHIPTTAKLIREHTGHENKIQSKLFFSNESRLLSSSQDGSVILWNVDTGDEIIRVYFFDRDPKKWVHLHPSGLFDASPEAMEMMYWTKGMEIIAFDQLKDRYWVPGLWEKVLNGESLPEIKSIDEIKLQPKVELRSTESDQVEIALTKRDGGYGKVAIFINGKEVISDARGSKMDTTKSTQKILYSIKDHPYLKDGENEIVVKASSADGFVQGRGELLTIMRESNAVTEPHFYGVVIGISEYANSSINLKFPVKDATAISKSIDIGASNLFGEDKTHIYSLTSESSLKPSKQNIEQVLKEISGKAKAEDIIFLYLSGHGISYGGSNGDFYFLTADATSSNRESYQDSEVRKQKTVSTEEWVSWIKTIPALKQVMIIDACGSGKAVENLITARNVEGSQIKAIDRMKDRTGMFIISGCAADAVSYEASQYGQGLLTYSLLQAMKGAALKEDKYIDVFTIMDHARETVPDLARGVGGIQEPQLLIPKGGSFDIGMLESQDKAEIPIAEPKRVFIRSILVDKKKYRDVLDISKKLNDELGLLTSKGDNTLDIVYFDADEYGNSCQITGGYEGTETNLTLDMTIVCGSSEESIQISATSVDDLVTKIIEAIR